MGIKENCLHQARMLPALFQTASSPKTAGSGLHDQHFPVLKLISQYLEQRRNSAIAEALNFNKTKKYFFFILILWITWTTQLSVYFS